MNTALKFFSLILVIFSLQTKAQNIKETTVISNLNPLEQSIYQWIKTQQLPNGLIKNTDNSSNSSLYNNALTALLFTSQSDFKRVEAIFDYFEKQRKKEFTHKRGGFSQSRNINGYPNHRTWMGDNAWLLIAINTYHQKTKTQKYHHLAKSIEKWLRYLQDKDGGLWGGLEANENRIPKNTEGMLDAYHAVLGFDDFHINILRFLHEKRWDSEEHHLTTSDENNEYSVALDLHSWSSCILEDFPESILKNAIKFKTTQTIDSSKLAITGFCFDIDNDCVWLEGTGQMVVAYQFLNNHDQAQYYLNEMAKTIITSPLNSALKGLPFVSNIATNFGKENIWKSAAIEPSISSSVWYLFGALNYNPFKVNYKKDIPHQLKFWLP